MENSVFICHPAHVYIQSILESDYVLTEWRGLDGNKDDTSLNGIEDYGDIFEALSHILRCPLCFGEELYNQTDTRTNRCFDWVDIAELLEADPSFRPPPN